MGTSKEILFSEFLSEEALKPEPKVEVVLEISNPKTQNYKLPGFPETSEDEVKNKWRIIRNYFRTGKKPGESESKTLLPVLLAPYLNSEELITDYPIFLSEENEVEHCSFSDLLNRSFKETFKEGEAAILFKNLSRIEAVVKKFVAKNDNFCKMNSAFDSAINELSKLKISGEDGIKFKQDIDKFKNNFPETGKLLGFSQQTAIYLLAHLLRNQFIHKRKTFVAEVSRLKSGLRDLLTIEKDKNSKSSKDKAIDKTFDFANTMIAFDKLAHLMPESASEKMPKQRYERITNCLQILESAESLLLKHNAIVIVGKNLSEKNNYKWKDILKGTDLRIAELNKSCATVSETFNIHIIALSKLIGAVRIAELELSNKFDEEIHGDYFSRFCWQYFTEEELELCPPVILIEDAQNLLGNELSLFSALLSSNKPVKVLAINSPLPFIINMNGNETDGLLFFKQELGALAISHRSAFVHQSAAYHPIHLLSGFESGLASSTPALFHVLMSSNLNNLASQNFLDASSAVEGRQFPLFTYNTKGEKWGSRFDINSNPQPDKDWPKYTFEITIDKNKTETLELAFTFADFFALNQKNNKDLLIVPPAYWTEDFIALSEYLELPADKLYSKVPFIWLADNENTLHKAAIPYSLVVAAKERLGFWNFIQELGGVNSFHVEQAVARTRKEMLEQKEQEIKDIKIQFEKQIEEVRTSSAGEAMDNLAGILLDIEKISPKNQEPRTKNQEPRTKNQEPRTKNQELQPLELGALDFPPKADPPPAEGLGTSPIPTDAAISTEPWIEGFRCTSCNECTNKYPSAFKYDGEKIAYIDDPATITFAQMIKAAEACPVKCIHPGMPLNPNEPGLEDLIARAKPFN